MDMETKNISKSVWSWQMQTIMFRMDKQQSPNVQHREPYSKSYDKSYGKEIKKKAYICITESLCYTENSTTM